MISYLYIIYIIKSSVVKFTFSNISRLPVKKVEKFYSLKKLNKYQIALFQIMLLYLPAYLDVEELVIVHSWGSSISFGVREFTINKLKQDEHFLETLLKFMFNTENLQTLID